MSSNDFLFNSIASVYGLFYNWQVRNFKNIFGSIKENFNFSDYKSVIDVGCGTGALCKVLNEYGLDVTGVDSAKGMLEVARKKISGANNSEPSIKFVHNDATSGLPFEDKSFDIAITTYVAHGLVPEERHALYGEMRRVSKRIVILLDYNEQRSIITDIVEWLEGGDYFNFIKNVKTELTDYFGNLKVLNTGERSAVYICKVGEV